MASISRLLRNSIERAFRVRTRNINTSAKKTSSNTEASPEKKNWITFGFSELDPDTDRLMMHISGFMAISVCLVFGGMFLAYVPDPKMAEWAQREAYLELRRRERLGLLPIDPWYFPPETLKVPSDEELGDTEIII